MTSLNLPEYDFATREHEGRKEILDPIRQQYVRLTPEEWVRQQFAQYLIQEHEVPRGLISIEHRLDERGLTHRADIVVFSRAVDPQLIVECKAPDVDIQQETFDQVARYNRVMRVPYCIVTNGREHYCCRIDWEAQSYEFLDALPTYDAW